MPPLSPAELNIGITMDGLRAACLLARAHFRHVGFVSLSIYSLAARILCSHRFGINVADRTSGRHMGRKIRPSGNGNEFCYHPFGISVGHILFGSATARFCLLGHAI